MIKFFRKIRQQLVNQNRISKYLIYAIGEIILVVIGILIALQINNNNEIRKNRVKETAYLENIKDDLLINKKKIDKLIEARNKRTAIAHKLIGHIEGDPVTDWHAFNEETIQIYIWQRFYQHNYTFQELISSGNLSFIESDSIKNNLFELESQYKQLKAEEDHWRFDSEELVFKPAYNTLDFQLILRDHGGEHDVLSREVFKEFFASRKIKNGYAMATVEFGIMNGMLRKMKKIINELIGLIDRDLGEEAIQETFERNLAKKLTLDSIGIIGTVLETEWKKTIPMDFSDQKKGIWKKEIYLKSGALKFRNGSNWKHQWGGKNFPSGKIIEGSGNDIIIEEAGIYQIKLDWSKNRYSFLKIEK